MLSVNYDSGIESNMVQFPHSPKIRTTTTTPAMISPGESSPPSLLTDGGEVMVVSEVEEDGGLGSVGGGVSPTPASGVDGVVMGGGGRSTTDGVGVGVGTAEV